MKIDLKKFVDPETGEITSAPYISANVGDFHRVFLKNRSRKLSWIS